MRLQIDPISTDSSLGKVVCEFIEIPDLDQVLLFTQVFDRIDATDGVVAASIPFPVDLIPDDLMTAIRQAIVSRAVEQLASKEV